MATMRDRGPSTADVRCPGPEPRPTGGADVGGAARAAPAPAAHADRRGVGLPTAFLWYRILDGRPVRPVPAAAHRPAGAVPPLLFFGAADPAARRPSSSSPARSPHTVIRPEQIDVRLADVVGIDVVKDEVVRSLHLFLAHAQLRPRDGRPAAPRPAVRGRPGHRQDLHRQGAGRRGRRAVPVRHRDVVPVELPGRDRSARSASTSGRCARRRASTAARSASSTSSTRSAWPAQRHAR